MLRSEAHFCHRVRCSAQPVQAAFVAVGYSTLGLVLPRPRVRMPPRLDPAWTAFTGALLFLVLLGATADRGAAVSKTAGRVTCCRALTLVRSAGSRELFGAATRSNQSSPHELNTVSPKT